MLTNYHTHSCFCDGNNTLEEMVLCAIEKGFKALGFSGHAYTPFDLRYCMQDTDGYIAQIQMLKEKYKDKIQIYCGLEEDAFAPADRARVDYILGSAHYVQKGERYYTVDLSRDALREGIMAFDGDAVAYADRYYADFVEYIFKRKPDIIGHFDLLTKFDETDTPVFTGDARYEKCAEKWIAKAAQAQCIFEVNTGAISRGYRKTPYPSENLLYVLKKADAGLILSSDCHNAQDLDCYFDETKCLLRDIGFSSVYALLDGAFVKCDL